MDNFATTVEATSSGPAFGTARHGIIPGAIGAVGLGLGIKSIETRVVIFERRAQRRR